MPSIYVHEKLFGILVIREMYVQITKCLVKYILLKLPEYTKSWQENGGTGTLRVLVRMQSGATTLEVSFTVFQKIKQTLTIDSSFSIPKFS
jgi:hypothetical protein